MKRSINEKLLALVFVSISVGATAGAAFAECQVVADGKKAAFDGTLTPNLMVEKRSMLKLDKLFPDANIVERIFKGEVVTCSNCTDQYVVCND